MPVPPSLRRASSRRGAAGRTATARARRPPRLPGARALMESTSVAMIALLDALTRPAARVLKPEGAHRLAVNVLARLPLPRPAEDDPRLKANAFGLDFANPIGL